LILLCFPMVSFAETLVPSSLDPELADVREQAFIPWSNPAQSTAYWKKLSPKNVPIYYERRDGNLSRDIYIPNPGIGYWVLAGLTKENLFKTHKEKLKIDDTLISASAYKDEKGNDIYWALWAPRQQAYLLTDKMKEFGISQARIEYSLFDKFGFWAASLAPFSGFITWTSLAVNLLLFVWIIVLFVLLARKRS
jgi:hypothetical protein